MDRWCGAGKATNIFALAKAENAHLRKLSKKFLETPEHPDDRTLELVRKIDHLIITIPMRYFYIISLPILNHLSRVPNVLYTSLNFAPLLQA